MKDLLEKVAMALVDHKDDLEVIENRDGGMVDLLLLVNPEDMGKVIGKQGRIANSMRQILKACAIKENVKVNLEIKSTDEQ